MTNQQRHTAWSLYEIGLPPGSGDIGTRRAFDAGWRFAVGHLRPLAEWHEDMGDVLWWKFPIEEAPYVGSPLDLGYTVEAEMVMRRYGEPEVKKLIREEVGGWPGYHTHFTLIPIPEEPK